ncbi:Protein phosphatase 1 regulatory subunit 3A [Larimichthys crocea]|uniref:Protein phosphatase 1 regulatory subunit 3A n=1 Tax=Larimichthys crocea TaxID=215358 RepID=A0A6G0IXN3_LARCR|nr:Protein phosphatase 1 regulatory subunit 3A [Larimichthys crocea]
MSSVTRLHLLSQSMLNASCQKQKRCSSLPTASLTESPMEFVGQLRPSGACSFLGVPGFSTLDPDLDDDEGECPLRTPKVLCLVQVKEFDTWDVPKLPGYDSLEGEGKDPEEYFLSPFTFCLPLSTEELFIKVLEQKVELETIELLPGTTVLKGVIRVLNISFNKAVYVRTTLDSWSSHFDLLAEYIPGSTDNSTDCFSFRLTLVPDFGDQGARVEFCLRYETPVGTFWANNNNRNYVLYCHQRMDKRKEKKSQKENVNKRSCLKTVGQNFPTVENVSAMEASSQENISTDVSKQGDKVDTMKAKEIPDVQSGTSEEDGQKLMAESRRNCSRRNRRKAARMARMRDIFAQRGGGANDTERDESPPEAKQATQEESPEEKQSFSDGSDKSGGSQFDSESLILDVTHDTSPAHECTSNSESEKLESINLADSATLTGGESARHLPDKPLHSNDELAPVERQSINKSVSEAVESSQRQGVSYECTSNTAAEPADTYVISAVSSESLVSKTDSFTFGTVLAPLYHQVFGRVGSESQSLAVEGKNATKHQISPKVNKDSKNVEEENQKVNVWSKDETNYSADIKVIGEVAESMPKAMMRHTHDVSVELKDEEIIVSGKNEHYKMEAAVSNLVGFCLADTTEVKNWEMMVEEEEKNILTDDEESEPTCSKAENSKVVETDQEMEVTDTETASENRSTTGTEKDEMVGEITAAGEKDAEDKQRIGEEQSEEIITGKNKGEVEKELEHVQTTMMPVEEELLEGIKIEEGEGIESEKAEKQEVNNKRINVQGGEEKEGEEEMEIDLDADDEANVEREDQVKAMEDKEKENPDYKEEILVDETGESEIRDAESDKENKAGFDITQTKAEDGLSALVNNVQDERVIEENTGEGQNAHIPAEVHLYKEEDFRSDENVTHDLSKAARDESEPTATEGGSCIFPDEPKSDQLGHDSASAESDSDDEVELYMHCLRAVHTGPQPHTQHNKDAGFSAGKRPSISRSKCHPSMPSISESLDEEPNLGLLQDTEAADFQPTALPASSGEESIDRNVSWWMESFSWSNISKTLLYATLLVIFVVVAYHYDFLACFGLYLISVIWLYGQGETQPVKNNNRLN